MSLQELLEDLNREFPGFEVRFKTSSRLMKCFDLVLKIITFWRLKSFMDSFVTTLGHTVYVPSKWTSWSDPSKAAVLRHERVHLRQQRYYGRLCFSFLYLFVLPVGFACYRTRFEKEAYEESLRALFESHGEAQVRNATTRKLMIQNFTGASYFWMWIRKKDIEEWYDATVDKLVRETSYS